MIIALWKTMFPNWVNWQNKFTNLVVNIVESQKNQEDLQRKGLIY